MSDIFFLEAANTKYIYVHKIAIFNTNIKNTSTISLLKFKQVIVYVTTGSIPAPKDSEAFPNKESIPMLALVIRIHK
jgi:hypothetical protein